MSLAISASIPMVPFESALEYQNMKHPIQLKTMAGTKQYTVMSRKSAQECSKAKGKRVRMTTYVDANQLFCYVTGQSCTGIIHLIY